MRASFCFLFHIVEFNSEFYVATCQIAIAGLIRPVRMLHALYTLPAVAAEFEHSELA